MTDPTQAFIADIDKLAAERKAHFDSMTLREKIENIYRIASHAAMKDDIRGAVEELAYHAMKDIDRSTGQ